MNHCYDHIWKILHFKVKVTIGDWRLEWTNSVWDKLKGSEIWIKFSFATAQPLNSVSTCCISWCVSTEQSIHHNVDGSVSDLVPHLDDLPGDSLLRSGSQQQSQRQVHQHLQPPQLLPGAVCFHNSDFRDSPLTPHISKQFVYTWMSPKSELCFTWLLFPVSCYCLEKCWNHSQRNLIQ